MSIIQARFGIEIRPEKVDIVHVKGREMLTSKGFLTMVMHMVLPIFYAIKCLLRHQPDIFYDTTGDTSLT